MKYATAKVAMKILGTEDIHAYTEKFSHELEI